MAFKSGSFFGGAGLMYRISISPGFNASYLKIFFPVVVLVSSVIFSSPAFTSEAISRLRS